MVGNNSNDFHSCRSIMLIKPMMAMRVMRMFVVVVAAADVVVLVDDNYCPERKRTGVERVFLRRRKFTKVI